MPFVALALMPMHLAQVAGLSDLDSLIPVLQALGKRSRLHAITDESLLISACERKLPCSWHLTAF
jgi:hypothetical protein